MQNSHANAHSIVCLAEDERLKILRRKEAENHALDPLESFGIRGSERPGAEARVVTLFAEGKGRS